MRVLTNELWQTIGSSKGCRYLPVKDHSGIVPASWVAGASRKTLYLSHRLLGRLSSSAEPAAASRIEREGSWGQPYLKSRQLNSLHCQPAFVYFILSISPESLLVSKKTTVNKKAVSKNFRIIKGT